MGEILFIQGVISGGVDIWMDGGTMKGGGWQTMLRVGYNLLYPPSQPSRQAGRMRIICPWNCYLNFHIYSLPLNARTDRTKK